MAHHLNLRTPTYSAATLFVLYPVTGQISRFDLTTFERETTAPLPFKGVVKRACTGAAAAAPVFVQYGTGGEELDRVGVALLDPVTLAALDLGPQPENGFAPAFREPWEFRATPDGRMVVAFSSDDGALNVFQITSAGLAYSSHWRTNVSRAAACGDRILTSNGPFTLDGLPIGTPVWSWTQHVTAQQGDLYLTIEPRAPAGASRPDPSVNPSDVQVWSAAGTKPERDGVVLEVGGFPLGFDGKFGGELPRDKRFLFSPLNGILARVALSGDKIVVHTFDLNAIVSRGPAGGVFAASHPPAAVPGKPLAFPIVVKSKTPAAAKLESGPAGLTVSADGKVAWDVPAGWTGPADVVVTLTSGGGAGVKHTFALATARAAVAPQKSVVAAGSGNPALRPPSPFIRLPARPREVTPSKVADGTELKLPFPTDEACYAGGGQFVLFRMPGPKEIAVLDVCAGTVVKRIPIPEQTSLFAGTNDHVFVMSGGKTVDRWSLTTFEKEASGPVPARPRKWPNHILAGHATDGPVFVAGPNVWLDPQTFQPTDLPVVNKSRSTRDIGDSHYREMVARLSADGRLFGWWSPDTHPRGLSTMEVGDAEMRNFYMHDSVGSVLPAPDGQVVLTGNGVFTPDLKPAGQPTYQVYSVPAARGHLFVEVPVAPFTGPEAALKASLRLIGEDRPVADLGNLPGVGGEVIGKAGGPAAYKRVHFIPDAHLLIVLNTPCTTLKFHKIDAEGLLSKSGLEYLFVTTKPPPAVRGGVFAYKPVVRSTAGGVRVKVDAGPDGMTAADGVVTWHPPADFAADSVPVILTFTDAKGKEATQSFALPVRNPVR